VLYIQGPAAVFGVVPTTGAILWQAPTNGLHWQSPIVVNGMVFWTDANRVAYAYGLP